MTGSVLFYLTFNLVSFSQKWDLSIPGIDFKNADYAAAAYYGILLCGPILTVQLFITQRYVQVAKSNLWAQRIPTFFDPPPNFSARDAKFLQLTLYVAFVLFAEIGQVHFLDKFFKGNAKYGAQVITPGFSKLTTFFSLSQAFDDAYKYYGYTYFPFWEPWLFLVGEVLLLLLCLRTTVKIFWK